MMFRTNLQLFLKGLLTVVIIATCCESLPVEPTNGDIDESATICPEKLAEKKLQSFNGNLEDDNSHINELENEKTEEKFNNNIQESPDNTLEDSNAFKFDKEQVEGLTSKYPEEEEDEPVENASQNFADSQDKQQEKAENLNKVKSEIITVSPEEKNTETQKNASENLKLSQDLPNNKNDSNLDKIKQNLKDSERTSTENPELEKKKVGNYSDLNSQKHQHILKEDSDPSSTSQDKQQEKAENSNEVGSEIVTVCPEEKHSEPQKNSGQNLTLLQDNLQENTNDSNLDKIKQNLKVTQEKASTENPEDLEEKKVENPSDLNFQKHQHILKDDSDPSNTSQDKQQEKAENSNEVASEIVTVCPQEKHNEPQKNSGENLTLLQDNLQENTNDSNLDKIKQNLKVTLEKASTENPENLEEKKVENPSGLYFQKHQHILKDDSNSLNSVQNEEDLSANTEETTNLDKKKLKDEQNQSSSQEESEDTKPVTGTENLEETATEVGNQVKLEKTELEKISEQASADRFQTDYDNDISKSLEYLTKYKALVSKVQKEKPSRLKRQTSDYTSSYGNQQNYNPKASSYSNQNQQGYPSQSYNVQAAANSNAYNQRRPSYSPQQGDLSTTNPRVNTYQQLRRQQLTQNVKKAPSYYPKSYQSNVNPIKAYRNPSAYYARYPSNGNVKNYRSNPTASRRQFQGAGQQVTSPSPRPTARITRKKFRPSPVFA